MMETDELEKPVVTIETLHLDTTVRCDRCGVQAYTEAVMASGLVLYFCKHHGDTLAPSLAGAGARLRTDHKLMAGLHG
jgi:hypothetical protein